MLLQVNSALCIIRTEFMKIHLMSDNYPEVWVLICTIQILGSIRMREGDIIRFLG